MIDGKFINLSTAADHGRIVETSSDKIAAAMGLKDTVQYQPLVLGDGGKVVQEEVSSLVDVMSMGEWQADDPRLNAAGGHGDDWSIATEIAASDSPRKAGFNYGGGWGKSAKPAVYFDGVRLWNVLSARAHEARNAEYQMSEALRNLRLAETPTEKSKAVTALRNTMSKLLSEDETLNLAITVEELVQTLDGIAPDPDRNPGYHPRYNLAHTLHPVRKLVQRLRSYLLQTEG